MRLKNLFSASISIPKIYLKCVQARSQASGLIINAARQCQNRPSKSNFTHLCNVPSLYSSSRVCHIQRCGMNPGGAELHTFNELVKRQKRSNISYIVGGTVIFLGLAGCREILADAANDAKALENKIKDRITRANSGMSGHLPKMLPWQCLAKDGRQAVRFSVLENSDLFFMLLSSVLEMASKHKAGSPTKGETRVAGSVSLWDGEMNTGIEIVLPGVDDCRVRISLPWADSAFPEVEITSNTAGFSDAQASFISRLIISGNSARASSFSPESFFSSLLQGGGMLPPFLQLEPPAVGEDAAGPGGGGDRDPAGVLRGLGCTVHNAPGGAKEEDGLPWTHLAGVDGLRNEVEESVLLMMTHPEAYDRIAQGTRQAKACNRPRAVLFEGPPGCGKTTMARMMACKASVPMVYVPLEAVVSKWYGDGEKRLAQVFSATAQLAKENGALLFLDEVEALAVSRDSEIHEASRRLLSVLLRSIDGFRPADRVTVIGATNRVRDIDAALRSRFELSIRFPLPDREARAEIFALYTKHLAPADRARLADATPAMSGRNIRDICEQTERRWAAKTIRGKAKAGSLPPVSEYEQVAARRRASGLEE